MPIGLCMSRESKGIPTSAGSNEPVATAPVLARWLGISGKAVYELAKAGVLVHVTRDHFLLEESVRRYCDHIRRTASQHDTDAGVKAPSVVRPVSGVS